MDYTTISLIVMLLCFSLSVFFVFLYFRDQSENRSRWGFAAYGLFVVGFLMFWSVLGLSMEDLKEGPCEYLLTSEYETYQYGNNYTGYHWDYDVADSPTCANPTDTSCVNLFHKNITYTYTYSCAERVSFGWLENIFYLVTWINYALWIGCLLIPVIYVIKLLVRKS